LQRFLCNAYNSLAFGLQSYQRKLTMTSFKRSVGAAVTAAMLVSSAAYAADVAPLPAGKPAGTKQAALLALGPIFWIGLAAIAIGIGVAASGNDKNTPTTPTTTTTGTGA
jgi:hypothetical protein